MTKDLLDKLKSSNDGYDSDETVIYYPGRVIKSKSFQAPHEECSTVPTASRWLIRAHPSRAGFHISLHR